MREIWLQKYIKEHYEQIGFTRLHGPYSTGADFKGVYAGLQVKIEAEWDYTDYIAHKHPLRFADILIVASLKPVPGSLIERLPPTIIRINPEIVTAWAQPRISIETEQEYHAYQWRRFSKSLLDLYACYLKRNNSSTDFLGSLLTQGKQQSGWFQFGSGGIETGFTGTDEEKTAWDCWLEISHRVAEHFNLKPALLRPTWADRIALYYNHTGRITLSEYKRFEEISVFIMSILTPE